LSKLSVSELANEFAVSAEDVVSLLRSMDIPIRSHRHAHRRPGRIRAGSVKRVRAEKQAAPAPTARRRQTAAVPEPVPEPGCVRHVRSSPKKAADVQAAAESTGRGRCAGGAAAAGSQAAKEALAAEAARLGPRGSISRWKRRSRSEAAAAAAEDNDSRSSEVSRARPRCASDAGELCASGRSRAPASAPGHARRPAPAAGRE
jgi:hypothetical protein